jgi:hypothetical protein
MDSPKLTPTFRIRRNMKDGNRTPKTPNKERKAKPKISTKKPVECPPAEIQPLPVINAELQPKPPIQPTAGIAAHVVPSDKPIVGDFEQTAKAEGPSKPFFGMGERILLAVATGFAYLAAYAFERGYCNHFAISGSMIHISLEQFK